MKAGEMRAKSSREASGLRSVMSGTPLPTFSLFMEGCLAQSHNTGPAQFMPVLHPALAVKQAEKRPHAPAAKRAKRKNPRFARRAGRPNCLTTDFRPAFPALSSRVSRAFSGGQLLRHRLGAMGAAAGGQRNLAQAFRAGLRGRRHFGLRFLESRHQLVHRQNNSEVDHAGHDQE